MIRQKKVLRTALIIAVVTISAFGWMIADTVTRPLSVQLKVHIRICEQTDQGWKVVDEAGPAVLNFQASLLDLGSSKKVSSTFVWTTKTKNGRQYSVRLADAANIHYNPASGQFDGDLPFEVTLDGKTARVAGKLTSELISSPIGSLKGKRAQGTPGLSPTTVTLVSANNLLLPGQKPILLVCTEEYTLTPQR